MKRYHIKAVVLLLSVVLVYGYEQFQAKIPNGDRVPNPGLPNYVWKGVGHNAAGGGGARNPFGQDFARNSFVWDECICNYDSDGDGKTNGEELGDPNCEWQPDSLPPARIMNLTHPGICEPMDSDFCLKQNSEIIFESIGAFKCDAIEAEDVSSRDIRFERTEVPAVDTSYYCDYIPLNLPANKSFHIVAFEPLIDNVEVMHHTLVYGCRDNRIPGILRERESKNITGPYECGRMKCDELVLIWQVGLNGVCYPSEYGQIIGEGGFKGVYIQHHWNNPLKKSGMTDASGIRFHYTERLRDNTAAWLLWGPRGLAIPVGAKKYVTGGSCPSECTSNDEFPESISIVEVMAHMHYAGRGLKAVHKRPGVFERVLWEDDKYSYDSPQIKSLDPPIEFRKGDEVYVNCTFNTVSQTSPLYWGDGTYDEMCFLLMSVYPYSAGIPTICMTNNGIGRCNRKRVGDFGTCDFENYMKNMAGYYLDLEATCDKSGVECRPGCNETIQKIYAKETCLGDEKYRTLVIQESENDEDEADRSYANMLVSCSKPVEEEDEGTSGGGSQNLDPLCPASTLQPVPGTASSIRSFLSLLTPLFIAACY